MQLDQIEKDGLFRISSLDSTNPCVAKLMAMGLLPGEEIRLIHEAPLGDPIAVEFNGCHMSLRLKDAAHIEVDPIPA